MVLTVVGLGLRLADILLLSSDLTLGLMEMVSPMQGLAGPLTALFFILSTLISGGDYKRSMGPLPPGLFSGLRLSSLLLPAELLSFDRSFFFFLLLVRLLDSRVDISL